MGATYPDAPHPFLAKKMNEYDIAAPLAAALAAQGLCQPDLCATGRAGPRGARGRDPLVSAQTGSARRWPLASPWPKTCWTTARCCHNPGPAAGATIAPTRELALQVARELGWLYAETGAQIATCVGGMDYRTERRALERGAQIVVGTPGRLRDHIERGSLDLSPCAPACWTRTDEMLDPGFREDLEFILGAAPADRRTLMFSMPCPGDRGAGQDFQRDALRISAWARPASMATSNTAPCR